MQPAYAHAHAWLHPSTADGMPFEHRKYRKSNCKSKQWHIRMSVSCILCIPTDIRCEISHETRSQYILRRWQTADGIRMQAVAAAAVAASVSTNLANNHFPRSNLFNWINFKHTFVPIARWRIFACTNTRRLTRSLRVDCSRFFFFLS